MVTWALRKTSDDVLRIKCKIILNHYYSIYCDRSAASHYYSTYQYIDGIPVMIKYYSEQGMYLDDGQIKLYFEMAAIHEEPVGLMCYYESESVRDDDTEQMRIIRDEIVFYLDSEAISTDKIIAKIPASSDIGRVILNRE